MPFEHKSSRFQARASIFVVKIGTLLKIGLRGRKETFPADLLSIRFFNRKEKIATPYFIFD